MILVDGDIMTYKASYSVGDDGTEEEIEEHLDAQFEQIMEDLLFDMEMRSYLLESEVYLTGKGNFRYDLAVTHPYKGERTGEKPIHLPYAREYLIKFYGAEVSIGCEADDLIAMRATKIGIDSVTIASVDKDFYQLGCEFYNLRTGELFVPEEPNHIFYEQVLTGDRVDNVKGIHGVGPVKAKRFLADIPEDDPKALWDEVVKLYEQFGMTEERAIENAQLLWLWREEGATWSAPE